MRQKNDSYDHICIGSSPLCLLEALHQAKSGRRVLVLDAGDKVGGAWAECSVFGLSRVEIAPHVFIFNRATFDFFAQVIGVEMMRMMPAPRYLIQTPVGPVSLPYALSPLFAYFTVPFHYLRNPQYRTNFALIREEYFGRLSASARQLLQWVISKRKPYIEYPVGGTVALLDKILERIRAEDIEVRLNSRVESIERREDNSVKVSWTGGEAVVSSVSATRHQRISRFVADGKTVDAEYVAGKYTMVHFLVTTSHPPPAAFVLAKRDPVVNLLSDLTPYTLGLPQGKRLLVVRLHRSGTQDSTEAAAVFSHLKTGGYISPETSMDDFVFSSFEQGRMTPESVARIEGAFGATLRIFRSTNFSNSIGDETARWRA